MDKNRTELKESAGKRFLVMFVGALALVSCIAILVWSDLTAFRSLLSLGLGLFGCFFTGFGFLARASYVDVLADLLLSFIFDPFFWIDIIFSCL